MDRIALFGASGAMGRSVADALSRANARFRVVGRTRGVLERQFGGNPLTEIVTWDPDDSASVRAACRGIDTIVYMVGVDYWRFELHPRLMRQTVDGATAEGVARMLLIGTVYPYGRADGNPVSEDHPREPHTVKGRHRKEQEDVLLAAARGGRLQSCILRLPDFYGPRVEKSLLADAFRAAVARRTANMIGPLDAPHEFLFVPDAGPVIVKLLATPGAFGHVWHLGGAGVTTQRALVEEIERQTGRPLNVRVAGRAMLQVMGVFNPMLRELVEMHYLMTDPLIMSDAALQGLIGRVAKTPYVQGVRLTLEAARADAGHVPDGKA
jgi:nucleoside-diphosphate-sugar epimerase